MNALPQRSRADARATAVRKSTLFCPDCERAASLDDWPVVATDGGETVACPDCDLTLTRR